ncbi:unnamed protein product [marine sediment metagenome]|uniref:Uncharacterized protein n=1 Tax=marine sediment metagenome TaxID=412755 RepID=X1C1K8_9ZZZZ
MIDKEQILQWFAHECDSSPEEGTGDEAEWVLTGKMRGLGTTIICPKGEDFIQIQRGIRIADDHKTIISGRSKDRQAEFHYNLKRGLLSTGAEGVDKSIDGLGAVQQGEIRVVVEVDEVSHLGTAKGSVILSLSKEMSS